MLCAIAFLAASFKEGAFVVLKVDEPNQFPVIVDFFKVWCKSKIVWRFFCDRCAQGRRQAFPPKFPSNLWNQHEPVISAEATTTNSEDGWQNYDCEEASSTRKRMHQKHFDWFFNFTAIESKFFVERKKNFILRLISLIRKSMQKVENYCINMWQNCLNFS